MARKQKRVKDSKREKAKNGKGQETKLDARGDVCLSTQLPAHVSVWSVCIITLYKL